MTLEFKRTSRFNLEKLSSKLRKDWISVKPARYRITFRRQVFGVSVPAAYQATCLCYVPGNWEGGKTQSWTFVDNKRKLFKTYRKAVEACERHARTWEKALLCPSMRAIKQLFGGHKPPEVPIWLFGKMHPSILRVIMDNTPVRFTDDELDKEHFEGGSCPEPEPELEPEKRSTKVTMHDIEEAMGQPMPKKRGRPKGSTNKPAVVSDKPAVVSDKPPAPKKRGRPKGATQPPAVVSEESAPKKRGRPKGSKNSKPRSDKGKKHAKTH